MSTVRYFKYLYWKNCISLELNISRALILEVKSSYVLLFLLFVVANQICSCMYLPLKIYQNLILFCYAGEPHLMFDPLMVSAISSSPLFYILVYVHVSVDVFTRITFL
jgi:hypothetical protein